jgi:hypothetical protein
MAAYTHARTHARTHTSFDRALERACHWDYPLRARIIVASLAIVGPASDVS